MTHKTVAQAWEEARGSADREEKREAQRDAALAVIKGLRGRKWAENPDYESALK